MGLAEDFMVLALREDDCRPLVGNLRLECGLAAAVLVGLAGAERIGIAGGAVAVRDGTPLGSAEEDAALARLAAEPPHDLPWWVRTLRTGQYERTLARLVDHGVITQWRARTLGVFPTVRRRFTDTTTGPALRQRLRGVLDGAPAGAGDVALLAIAHATTLDRLVFRSVDPAAVERAIGRPGDDPMALAVASVIHDVQAAVIAAVTAAV